MSINNKEMKIVLQIFLLILFSSISTFAQYQTTTISYTNNTATLRCTGYGKNAKEATQDAELSGIKTVLFIGVDDSPFSNALISDRTTNNYEKDNKDFFKTFYLTEYKMFIQSSVIVLPFAKNDIKQKCITIDVCVRISNLREFLESNGIIRKFGL